MTFSGDLRGFGKRAGIRMDQIVRKVTIDVTGELVKGTPVDTGLARSSYFFGNEFDAKETTASKNGAPSLERCGEFASNLEAGGVFFITNNLPYILPIVEYGHSKQAAPGSVTRLVAKWQGIVDKAARL